MGLNLQLDVAQQIKITPQLKQAINMLQMSAQDLRSCLEKEYLENPLLELEYNVPYSSENRELIFNIPAQENTLERELWEQAEISFKDDRDAIGIAKYIIGSLDERGYMILPIEELAQLCKSSSEKIAEVLQVMQKFDPPGICANSLIECLSLQAIRKRIFSGALKYLIQDGLQLLAEGGIKAVAKQGGYSVSEIQNAVDLLKNLNPKPASGYDDGSIGKYITPDVYIEKSEDNYHVSLNDAYIPMARLSIDDISSLTLDEGDKKYISSKISEARWLLNSIEQRRKNIISMMTYMVSKQQEFIEKGELYLKPMSMAEAAKAIGVHESTVSRIAANKYVELPWGMFPIRRMFSANIHYTNQVDNDITVTKIKSLIQNIIQDENPQKPLSDSKIKEKLEAMGINIARRTVVKYREQLGFFASNKRKRYSCIQP